MLSKKVLFSAQVCTFIHETSICNNKPTLPTGIAEIPNPNLPVWLLSLNLLCLCIFWLHLFGCRIYRVGPAALLRPHKISAEWAIREEKGPLVLLRSIWSCFRKPTIRDGGRERPDGMRYHQDDNDVYLLGCGLLDW